MNLLIRRFLFVGAFVLLVSTILSAGPSGYHVSKTIKLGGDGGWDYLTVDAQARRVYISRGTHVMVVDADSGALIGDIPNTNGVHGIAIAPGMDKGFIKDATAIDAKTGTVAGTIALGGKPEFAVADEKGHIFVNIEDTSEIVQFNSDKLAVESRWKIAPGEEPSGLAMDRKHRRLFSVCSNKLMVVVDADNGRVVTTLPIGAGTDAAGFDPETGFAFSSNGGDGTLTVAHEDSPDKFAVVENVPTLRRARTMALDAKTHQVYTVTAEFGQAPAPTTEQPRPRAPMVPGSFTLLILSR